MKYNLGSEKDFHDFLDSIREGDKINLITHIDLDGLASGFFVQKILESKGLKVSSIDFLNYGAEVLKDYSDREDFDYLIISDLNADEYVEGLNLLRKKGKVLVFDHHPLNEGLDNKEGIIKTEGKYCSSHALFNIGISGGYLDAKKFEWLVCSSIISDYTWDVDENFNFLKSVYPNITKKGIWESEPGKIGKKISNAIIYYKPDYQKVYDFLLKKDFDSLQKVSGIIDEEISMWIKKFKSEAEFYPEKKLYFYYENPEHSISNSLTTILSSKHFENETLVFVYDLKGKENHVRVSSRNQTGDVDLGKVLKKSTEGFENSSAGGHIKASGADFPKEYLGKFKENLLSNL